MPSTTTTQGEVKAIVEDVSSELDEKVTSQHQHSHALLPSQPLLSPSSSTASVTVDSSFHLYRRRWFVLTVFSAQAFLNNVVCYSFASIGHVAKQEYPTIDLPSLVTYFFLTYVIFSIPSAIFIDKFGLRSGLILGGWLQTLGCYMRWYDRGSGEPGEVDGFVCWLRVGQAVASLGQAMFVNPPPLMAAIWFGPDERVLATTVSVNANTLGIAGAWILGSWMVHQPSDIDDYLLVITLSALTLATITTLFLPAAPPTPPSFSQHHANKRARKAQHALSLSSVLALFKHRGFIHTCLAFALAEASINGLSAFMSDILIPDGYANTFVGLVATLFIVMCMVGSGIVGWFVDKTHLYLLSVCSCLLGGALCVLALIYSDTKAEVLYSILSLGFFLGPIQPLVIEVGVECTYPSSSSTVAALQQILGNLGSAAAFPLMMKLRRDDGSMDLTLFALALSLAVMGLFYATFRGEYRRIKHETEGVLANLDSVSSQRPGKSAKFDYQSLNAGSNEAGAHHGVRIEQANG